jgi:hypothetical protein
MQVDCHTIFHETPNPSFFSFYDLNLKSFATRQADARAVRRAAVELN